CLQAEGFDTNRGGFTALLETAEMPQSPPLFSGRGFVLSDHHMQEMFKTDVLNCRMPQTDI
ncbi:hypothetical protein, partial [Labrenzia sp. DG1229]|uniref:hypothetical protein n=1 Tax=Labrenzia sp. DG1229 TaxID=681847 RepID=UPI001AD94DDD